VIGRQAAAQDVQILTPPDQSAIIASLDNDVFSIPGKCQLGFLAINTSLILRSGF
jgi:hypothetical protein